MVGKSRLRSRAANPCPAGCPKAFIASLALCNAVDTVVGLGWICAGKIGICEGFQVHSIIQMVLGIYKVYIYIFVLRCFKGGLIFMYL